MALPVPEIVKRLGQVSRTLEATFLGKSETVRLMLVAACAGEHMLLVGPPGTAKSALVRMFSKLVDARYFEYLLTRFTEPNEIFGPIDIAAFLEVRDAMGHDEECDDSTHGGIDAGGIDSSRCCDGGAPGTTAAMCGAGCNDGRDVDMDGFGSAASGTLVSCTPPMHRRNVHLNFRRNTVVAHLRAG